MLSHRVGFIAIRHIGWAIGEHRRGEVKFSIEHKSRENDRR